MVRSCSCKALTRFRLPLWAPDYTVSTNQYHREYKKKRYYERLEACKYLLGDCCTRCGEIEGLEFDHIDPYRKVFTITTRIGWTSWSNLMRELSKCQLLCYRCHQEKSLDELGRAEHGTLGMHRHQKCRCDLCRESYNAYSREWKKRKRACLV